MLQGCWLVTALGGFAEGTPNSRCCFAIVAACQTKTDHWWTAMRQRMVTAG